MTRQRAQDLKHRRRRRKHNAKRPCTAEVVFWTEDDFGFGGQSALTCAAERRVEVADVGIAAVEGWRGSGAVVARRRWRSGWCGFDDLGESLVAA